MKFAEKLEKLDAILNKLEREKIPLEESLSLFEEGVALIRDCQKTLAEVEQKITILMDDGESDMI